MIKGAVIIETRPIDITKIIDNHFKWLTDEWELMIFGSKENEDIIINCGYDCSFVKLPQSLTNGFSAAKYNELITSRGFWSAIDFEKVLIFQHDSQLLRCCIDDFIDWDYIGAPWSHINMLGGNGGLSLRTKQKMIDVIDYIPYNAVRDGNEDLYFCKNLPKVGGKVAPKEIAQQFSVETIYYPNPVGVHAAEKYLSQQQLKTLLG